MNSALDQFFVWAAIAGAVLVLLAPLIRRRKTKRGCGSGGCGCATKRQDKPR